VWQLLISMEQPLLLLLPLLPLLLAATDLAAGAAGVGCVKF